MQRIGKKLRHSMPERIDQVGRTDPLGFDVALGTELKVLVEQRSALAHGNAFIAIC